LRLEYIPSPPPKRPLSMNEMLALNPNGIPLPKEPPPPRTRTETALRELSKTWTKGGLSTPSIDDPSDLMKTELLRLGFKRIAYGYRAVVAAPMYWSSYDLDKMSWYSGSK
jgi:hypothetical protein